MDEKDDANLGEGTQGMPIKSSSNNTKKDLFKAKVDELMLLSSYSNSSSDLNNKIGLNEKGGTTKMRSCVKNMAKKKMECFWNMLIL
jgi:hypothetical protein